MAGGQFFHHWRLKVRSLAQRAVSLDGDPQRAALARQIPLLVRGVEFDLVEGGNNLGLGQEGVNMLREEVGDADGSRLAVGVDLLHGLPRIDEEPLGRNGPVDEVKVHVVQAKCPEAVMEGLEGFPLLPVAELCGDKEFFPRESGGCYRGTDTGLVAVGSSRINVAVPRFQGIFDDALRLFRRDLEYPKPKLRDPDSVIEGDLRNEAFPDFAGLWASWKF